MAEKWKPQPKRVLLEWLKALSEPAVVQTLNSWEEHFVSSIGFQLERTGTISQVQQEKLEGIYAVKTK